MVEVRSQYKRRPMNSINGVWMETDHSNFYTIREWLWESYGASKELKHWLKHHHGDNTENTSHNPNWCWDTEYLQHRIYLSEDALVAFTLKWL